jgi:recombination protein RecR
MLFRREFAYNADMTGTEIENLMKLMARLPGLGPRSARRAALHLLKNRESLMLPLAQAMERTAEAVEECPVCHNLDAVTPCAICRDSSRDATVLCVVEDIADLWAVERSGAFRGRYHVLGGTLSALDGIGPEDLAIPGLIRRVREGGIGEVIVALSATVDGQTTAHYVAELLKGSGADVTQLARGVPVGGQIDWLDDGTLATALKARKSV